VSGAPAIAVERLEKRFGAVSALDRIDLTVDRGTLLGLLGPNGAGKTTLVRILGTLLVPDRGHARVLGRDVVADAFTVRAAIGLAGQHAASDEILTGRENLVMVGRLYRLSKREAERRADEVLERFELAAAADRRVAGYSGGMRRRLDLASSLVGTPSVLLLDEPTAGLDPHGRATLWETIRHLHQEGTTILLTTQYLEEADRLAERIVVLDQGRIVADDAADELKARAGGEQLVVRVADRGRAEQTRELLSPLCANGPATSDELEVRLPVTSARHVCEAVDRLDRAGVEVAGVELRRPTLDEVFLRLTGTRSERSTVEQEQA
jgi:ABC-2 type transport system ATP-binding protein